MLFNSTAFLLFFTAVLAVDMALQRHARARKVFLLAASYFFYGSWDWRFLGLIGISTAVDYLVGLRLATATAPRTRRLLLNER